MQLTQGHYTIIGYLMAAKEHSVELLTALGNAIIPFIDEKSYDFIVAYSEGVLITSLRESNSYEGVDDEFIRENIRKLVPFYIRSRAIIKLGQDIVASREYNHLDKSRVLNFIEQVIPNYLNILDEFSVNLSFTRD